MERNGFCCILAVVLVTGVDTGERTRDFDFDFERGKVEGGPTSGRSTLGAAAAAHVLWVAETSGLFRPPLTLQQQQQ